MRAPSDTTIYLFYYYYYYSIDTSFGLKRPSLGQYLQKRIGLMMDF